MHQPSHQLFARSILVSSIALGAAFGVHGAQGEAGKSKPATESAQASGQKKPAQLRQLLASDMLGMSVRGGQGNNIGQIEDLAIDIKTGEVRYAVLEFDPGFFSSERLIAVPVKELRMGPNGNSLLYQNASKDKLEKLALNDGEWNDGFLRNKDRLAKLDADWGLPRFAGTSLMRANNLMDKEVQNKAGENIGEIEDLVINMDQQKVHYAMLEFERSWLKPEKTVAVPITAFSNAVGSGDDLVMDTTQARIKDMKGLTRDQMRNPNEPEVIAIVQRHIVFLEPKTASSGASGAPGGKSDARASGASGAAGPSAPQK